MAAGLILLALMASLVLSRARNGPAALSSLRFNEIDMELVDLEPQTFDYSCQLRRSMSFGIK